MLHAYRDLRNRLVLFEEVDVSTTMERTIEDESRVIPTIIRAANRKTVLEIQEDLQAARDAAPDHAEVYRSIRLYLLFSPFI